MSDPKSHIRPRVPGLHSLHVFEVAARHESFVQAAAELCVTHGAVSRQVRQLEEQLGIALFERRNRAVFLTPAGRRLSATCRAAIDEIKRVVCEVASSTVLAPLVVSCEPTIAMRWLIPRLPRFRRDHPDFEIHLLAAGGPIDFVRDRVDLALRRSDFTWCQTLHVERIASEWMGPVCTPELAKRLESTDRSGLRELHALTRPSAWAVWRRDHPNTPALGEIERFEHFYLCLQAANAGLGMGIGSIYMVEDDVRDGRLLAPYGFAADGSEYVLLSPQPFADDPRKQRFTQWVRHEMLLSDHRGRQTGTPTSVTTT